MPKRLHGKTRSGRQQRDKQAGPAEAQVPEARCPVCGGRAPRPQDSWRGRWACESCLTSGRALRPNLSKQACGMASPIRAYYSWSRTCRDCEVVFDFSATEQRYWYETLGFVVDSAPVRCPACRRRQRRRKSAQRELHEATAQLDTGDLASVQRIAALHEEAGHVRKAAEWHRRAHNLARRLQPDDED